MLVHADSRIVVINKPSGIPSVPLTQISEMTAVRLALKEFPELEALGQAVGRPLEAGLIHRLDTGTSGLLAFARDAETYERLRDLWKSSSVKKTYRALVTGEKLPRLPLALDVPLGRSAKSSKRMLVVHPGREYQLRGKPLPAHTEVLSARSLEGGVTDVEVVIRTGVMHQIRCHLSSIDLPILGDKTYGGKTAERLWLHAWKLLIPVPDGSPLELSAPLPEGWPG